MPSMTRAGRRPPSRTALTSVRRALVTAPQPVEVITPPCLLRRYRLLLLPQAWVALLLPQAWVALLPRAWVALLLLLPLLLLAARLWALAARGRASNSHSYNSDMQECARC
jgi:hypothetical protein